MDTTTIVILVVLLIVAGIFIGTQINGDLPATGNTAKSYNSLPSQYGGGCGR